MFSEANRTKKDVLADLVSLKYDVQAAISETSLRKATLASSENDVKDDMGIITERLERLLRIIHDNAKSQASKTIEEAKEKVNDEILYLEELYHSIEDTEEFIKNKASNTNLKPLQIGKEKHEFARTSLQQFKSNVVTQSARFVLHPLLARILEEIENFTLGKTLLMSVNEDTAVKNLSIEQVLTQDPIKTTFSRSNTSKMVVRKSNILRRQITESEKVSLSEKSNMTEKDVVASVQNLVSKDLVQTSTVEKKSKLISSKRPKSDRMALQSNETTITVPGMVTPGAYNAVTGLRATITNKSSSEPFINLTKQSNAVFATTKTEETPLSQFKYQETLTTKKHSGGCYITGIAALDDGSVIVCDSVHDSVQMFNHQLKAVSEVDCHHPWGACVVAERAVAVSLHYDHAVALYKANKDLQKLNEKDIILKCSASLVYDVKFSNYRLYVICSGNDIHVLDLKGRQFTVIKMNDNINCPLKYFDVDSKGELIVAAGENRVLGISKGLPLWQFNAAGRSKIVFTGILIVDDKVLMCDWENFRIVEVYNDGQGIRTVASENLHRPVVLSLCRSRGTLFVSQGDYNMEENKTRQIKVFQLHDLKES